MFLSLTPHSCFVHLMRIVEVKVLSGLMFMDMTQS